METVHANPKLKLNKEIVTKLKLSSLKNENIIDLEKKGVAGCCDGLFSFTPSTYGSPF